VAKRTIKWIGVAILIVFVVMPVAWYGLLILISMVSSLFY
jgi:hypothetical protein